MQNVKSSIVFQDAFLQTQNTHKYFTWILIVTVEKILASGKLKLPGDSSACIEKAGNEIAKNLLPK